MCDIAGERQRIDAILALAAEMEPVRNCLDENRLAEFGLMVLGEYYSDACPDECLRKRCVEFATRLARRRRGAARGSAAA